MRAALLTLALLVDLALLGALRTPSAAPGVVHPVALPLTRIAALGDRPLLRPRATLPAWTAVDLLGRHLSLPAQRDALERLRRESARGAAAHGRADTLRLALARDAVEMARVLGPERVRAGLALREQLAAHYGEQRTWDQAVAAVSAP